MVWIQNSHQCDHRQDVPRYLSLVSFSSLYLPLQLEQEEKHLRESGGRERESESEGGQGREGRREGGLEV